MPGGPPEIPPRSYQTVGRSSGGRAPHPHQDIATPPSNHNQPNSSRPQPFQELFNPPTGSNQQSAPIIPPRPGSRAPDNPFPPTHAPTAPPPPPPPPPMPATL